MRGVCLRKQCQFSKEALVYESSASFQNQRHFTKVVPVSKTAACLRKQCLFSKEALVYESITAFQNRRRFTKPVSVSKRGASLRKKRLFPKQASLPNHHPFPKNIPTKYTSANPGCQQHHPAACLHKQNLW